MLMYVKSFITNFIVFICNIITCLTLHLLIIFTIFVTEWYWKYHSVRFIFVTMLILKISLRDIKGKMYKLLMNSVNRLPVKGHDFVWFEGRCWFFFCDVFNHKFLTWYFDCKKGHEQKEFTFRLMDVCVIWGWGNVGLVSSDLPFEIYVCVMVFNATFVHLFLIEIWTHHISGDRHWLLR